MTQTEKIETKTIIIKQARLLFSQHGFAGTSVRKIAEASDVNLAAINYHFGSKEGLYWSVILEAMEWLDGSVKNVIEKSNSVEEMTKHLFKHFRDNSEYVTSTMKTFLSDLVPPPDSDHPYIKKLEGPEMGPPGGEHIADFLEKLYPETSKEARQWFVNCLFGNIIHFSTVTCSSHYENVKKEHMPVEMIEANLQAMATALINHATNKTYWSK